MSEPTAPPLDLDAIRQKLAGARGPTYWRTLEELTEAPGFRELLEREAPQVALLGEHLDRRKFLTLMGASLALAGLSGCGVSQAPPERIHPYVRQPERIVPGRPLFYATAMPLAGYANGGLLVESHEGRPTKIEGNPDHPGSPRESFSPRTAKFGPTDVFAQASILELYDPDRSHTVQYLGDTATWDGFRNAMAEAVRRPERVRLRLLTGTVTSPTLAHQVRTLLRRFPQARWHQWEPAGGWAELEGARLAFGRYVATQYRFDQAACVLALDADFLACRPGPLRYVRDFMEKRRYWNGTDRPPDMNRLYVVECLPTGTGAKADHRVPLRPSQVEAFARAVASRLGISVGNVDEDGGFDLPAGWLDALVQDLRDHRGRGIVLAGDGQPPVVHALTHAMNQRLGNVGRTVFHTAPVAVPPRDLQEGETAGPHDQAAALRQLAEDMAAGRVDLLLTVGTNPVYTAPADLNFEQRLQNVRLRVHVGPYFDETAAHCHWHVPEAHYLELWGDVRAHDGTVTIIQPLIAPLYSGRTALEVLGVLAGDPTRTAHDIVRDHWRRVFDRADDVRDELRGYGRFSPAGDFETWWLRALNAGYIPGTEAPSVGAVRANESLSRGAAPTEAQGLELAFQPDPSVFDGRFTNSPWLQELPKPLSKIVWENVAYVSPKTAVDVLHLAPSTDQAYQANGKVATLRVHGREITAPVWVLPGHADGAVTVTLGYGRQRAGRIGTGLGYDAYKLRTSEALGFVTGVTVQPTGSKAIIATTQHHHLMENRELVRSTTADHFSEAVREARHEPPPREGRISLFPVPAFDVPNKWGMTIDLNVCTGCQACVVACQSENNIPVVGKEEVLRGREMHWLRIDSYYKQAVAGGNDQHPLSVQLAEQTPTASPRGLEIYFEPVPCMHCETAPCELVCPVEATAHSSDGLNDMVYNRCVGTRYCSNNCPYKVRRFNFFQYADFNTEPLWAHRNPDVTVRSRGVMEKCTYCVQRIRSAQIESQLEDRPIRDFEVMTACQSACPAGAIVFGDLNGRQTRVAQMQAHPLNYGLLADLNTRPRTTYLWALRNPNERIAALEGHTGHPREDRHGG